MLSLLVNNEELASLWNLFESMQSRSTDKYSLDKDIFFTFINIEGLWALRLFQLFCGTQSNKIQQDKVYITFEQFIVRMRK